MVETFCTQHLGIAAVHFHSAYIYVKLFFAPIFGSQRFFARWYLTFIDRIKVYYQFGGVLMELVFFSRGDQAEKFDIIAWQRMHSYFHVRNH